MGQGSLECVRHTPQAERNYTHSYKKDCEKNFIENNDPRSRYRKNQEVR